MGYVITLLAASLTDDQVPMGSILDYSSVLEVCRVVLVAETGHLSVEVYGHRA